MKENGRLMATIRFIVTTLLMVNAYLTAKGLNPIPFDETALTEWLVYGAGVVSMCWTAWKDNNVTAKANAKKQLADKVESGEVIVMDVTPVEDPEDIKELNTEYTEVE